jgi:hypothetical protein
VKFSLEGQISHQHQDWECHGRLRVTKSPNGGWDAKRAGGSRASVHRDRQSEAYDAARDLARNSGGGEVRIHGTDGKIRNSNTIGKPDPNPPRDTKH